MKSPIQPNCSHFSINTQDSRYHIINPKSKNLSDQPRSSLRVRDSKSLNSNDTKYLKYSVPGSLCYLDLSLDLPEDTSVFPRNLYKKNPFAYSPSYNIIPRDTKHLYTYSPNGYCPKEQNFFHTATSSRFGYDRFPNEYGLGTQSRGYIEPPGCSSCSMLDIPRDMAPERFYSDFHLFNTPTEFIKLNSCNWSEAYDYSDV